MNKSDFIKKIIISEGGEAETNYSTDRGGQTKFGITKSAYTDFLGRSATSEDISNLTYQTATDFYSWLYDRYGLDSYPSNFRYSFFDTITIAGFGGASGILQKALVKLGQPIKVDYNAGKQTREATSKVDPELLKIYFLNERELFHRNDAAQHSEQQMYLQGWLNRVNHLRDSND